MIRLALFGGFTLSGEDGAAVVIASRKCRALLAYLALQPRPAPRERLAGLLWGDGPEARARGSLRQALTTLRHELPGEGTWLLATAEAIAIDQQELLVDARAADELLRAGQIARALELSAAGELMAGMSAGAPEFDEWREGEQRRWRERETAALRALAEQARAAGRHPELLALGRRLLRLEPWNEEAHRAVMAALAQLGRHTEALRQYQLAREALGAELGIAPGPETERLVVQIRAARTAAPSTAPVPVAAAPVVAGADARTHAGAAEPVGREVELRQLAGLLQGCRASGRGHVIVVRGEAGMGKTTLLQQALARAREAGFVSHLVQVGTHGGGRNLEVVRGVLAALDAGGAGLEAHRLALDELRGVPLGAGQTALAAALDPDARAQAHTRALEALVARAGAQQPAVLAVEDLHWSDAETTRVLCTVAGAAPRHRTVVIFTCRSGEEPADLAWAALVRQGSLTSIDLGPLAPEESARLAARYPHLAPDLARRCVERAAGHPLFLLQLLDSGGAGDAVPGSVQAAVVSRLARVAPADRRVLDAAAVLDSPFSLDQMAQLLSWNPERVPDLPRWNSGGQAASVPTRLGQESVDATALVQQGWLRPVGTRLALAHDLLGQAIRSALDEPALARLHHLAAGWFASRDPLTSAEHLERAGDRGAAQAYLSVAREALDEHRLDLAEQVLGRVDACPAGPDLLFEAACLRGDLRRERGDAAGSHAVFARAAGGAASPEQRVRARLGMAAALRLLDRHREALGCLADVEAETAADDHTTRAQLEHLRGNLLFALGDRVGCQSAHERALVHARAAESPVDEAAALSGLGDAHYLGGRVISADSAFEACRQLARAHGILRMEAAAGMMLGSTALYQLDLARAEASVERARELADRIADPRLQSLAEVVAAWFDRERGAWAEARAHSERALAAARRLGSERLEALALDSLARTLLGEGRRKEALGFARQALTRSQRSGGLSLIGGGIFSTLALAETDPAAAAAAVAQGEQQLAEGCPSHNHFELREAGIRLAARRGDWAEARRHAAALEQYLGDEPCPYADLWIEATRQAAKGATDPAARERLAAIRARAVDAGMALIARALEDLTFTPV
jgi:DNA-binding SARP family transcriptional activator